MKKLYIDGGCFVGDSIIQFINNQPDCSGNKFKLHDSSEFEIHGFDRQMYVNEWKDIASKHNNVRFNVCLLGDTDRIIEFHAKENCMCNSIFWHKDNQLDTAVKTTSMNQIDLLTFIANKRARGVDYVVAKLDIEGSEYAILEKMFNENSYQLFNELYIEFHDFLFPDNIAMKNKTIEFKNKLKALNCSTFHYVEWAL
jgi:hypothetical protein